MTEDWFPGDPFADPDDPAAAEREAPPPEREERRKTEREEKHEEEQAAPEPAPRTAAAGAEDPGGGVLGRACRRREPPPPVAPPPPRQGALAPSPHPPPPVPGPRRRRLHRDRVAAGLRLPAPRRSALRRIVLKTITVTIPEGYSRAQTAPLAEEDGLRGSYEKATRPLASTSTRPSTAARTPRTSRASSSPTPSN